MKIYSDESSYNADVSALTNLKGDRIPNLIDHKKINDKFYVITGTVGTPIEQQLQKVGGAFNISHVKKVGRDLLRILEYTHKKGWFHGDICPDNVVVFEDSYILVDWECSSELGSKYKQFFGRRVFASPVFLESMFKKQLHTYSIRDDLYSLMYTLLHLAQGDLAWSKIKRGQEELLLKTKTEYKSHPYFLRPLVRLLTNWKPDLDTKEVHRLALNALADQEEDLKDNVEDVQTDDE
eukprot:TRINITY_DN905_c0_g1_i3.p1 TRINITY_DN905_c0_g1~~TRINITY_DN905_c0_g1_i3.p1  ORF type:complete len:237 (+),score=9.37 TRINITY_DN905_c0_g1_i3:222-932(+)